MNKENSVEINTKSAWKIRDRINIEGINTKEKQVGINLKNDGWNEYRKLGRNKQGVNMENEEHNKYGKSGTE